MKKFLLIAVGLILSACAQDPYHLKINNSLAEAHGQSIYFRSNMRSEYSGQIRRILSKKLGESGLKTATSTDNADYIAIFDIENFYKNSGDYKNTSYTNTATNTPLFTTEEESSAMAYTGNANMVVNSDKTCFTLKIGRKDTSNIAYDSSFCASDIFEVEQMLPLVLDVYSKYGNYTSADVGVQCITNLQNEISCSAIHDRQQAFINSLWIEHNIVDDSEIVY